MREFWELLVELSALFFVFRHNICMEEVMPYTIRQMLKEEAEEIFNWGKREGWNCGLHDWDIMYDINPKGYLVGVLDGKVIGCIAAVHYEGKYSHLALLMVEPEYRGRGYGLALWKHALNYLNEEVGVDCIGLDAVLEREKDYQNWGFRSYYKIFGYTYKVDKKFTRPYPSIDERHFADIAEYDLKIFKVNRASFLHDYIFKTEAKTAVAYEGNRLVGFTVARPCWRGYKACPIFADTTEVAKGLLESVLADLPGQMVTIEVPEPNKEAMRLPQDFDMKPWHPTVRMYTSDKYQQDIRYIYTNTTRVVG